MPISYKSDRHFFHRVTVSFKILRMVGAAERFRVALLRLRFDIVTVSAGMESKVATTAVSAIGRDAGA